MRVSRSTRLTVVQEYYEEEPIRELYQTVVERLLTILDDRSDEENAIETTNDGIQGRFLVRVKKQKVWPPWPWPPWDGEDGGGGGGDGGEDRPPKHHDMHELAKKVVDFESKMANASLDL